MQILIWFRGLRGKLTLMIAAPILMIMCLVGASYTAIKLIEKDFTEMANVKMNNSIDSQGMEAKIHSTMRSFWNATILSDVEKRKQELDLSKQTYADFTKDYERLSKRKTNPKYKEVLETKIIPNVKIVKSVLDESWALLEKNTEKDTKEAIDTFLSKGTAPLKIALESFQDGTDINILSAAEDSNGVTKQIDFFTWAQLIGAVIGVLLLMGMGYFTARKLAKTLTDISSSLSGASNEVSAASQQLSLAGQQVSNGSTNAASSLEETVASIEELSSIVRNNANNAKQAANLSSDATNSAEEGEREIKQLIESMGDIDKSSKQIEEIIDVIDDIAFQTNLLALNAAVEAARAGEQGKGFAVVAEAVRSLAQRSSSAAKDISVLIKESVSRIERGTKIADKSGSALNNIVTNIKKVSALNSEISSASEEQAGGISQISKAMTELDSSSQSNAAAAEEVAASATEMSSQANLLQGIVEQLVVVIDGNGSKSTKEVESKLVANYVEKAAYTSNTNQNAKTNLTVHAGGSEVDPEDVIPFNKGNAA